ncbi:MAG: hypothetical protein RL240_1790 [Planctomycetota bacterium]|jgi:hypothetical protein
MFAIEKTKILVLVMTYPLPSRGYQELVCTAGITDSGEWVRLYPIDYRYRPLDQQFKKYQWIEVELEPRGAGKDQRKESRRPVLESIKILGEKLSTKDGWKERRAIIDKMPHRTRKQLEEAYSIDKTSLGIVRPSKIIDLEIRDADSDWKPEWQNLFQQMRLFGPQQKPLRKIPYSFHYKFLCEDSDKPHYAMCEDWELGVLFLNESVRLGSDEKAAESVKKKFFSELCSEDKDTRFYMGTFFPYNTWLVLGVFYPPKPPPALQQTLFQLD